MFGVARSCSPEQSGIRQALLRLPYTFFCHLWYVFCKLFVKQTIFLSRFAVFCRINKQKSKKRFPTLCSDKKSFKNKSLLFSFYAPPNPLRHDRLLKDLMPQVAENRFRHRCFCRILSVGRSAAFSRSAYARIGKVRYIIFMTAEKGCRTEYRITVFFSFLRLNPSIQIAV